MLWVVADVGQQDGGAVGFGEGHGLAAAHNGVDAHRSHTQQHKDGNV